MNAGLVSVIIPTYNRDRSLDRALASVQDQTYQDLEIIIIDDGSTDGTEALVKKRSANDRRIRYAYQENTGVTGARNHGIKIATGDYIAFLDSDDFWQPWKIQLQLTAINHCPQVGMVWTNMEAVNVERQVVDSRYLRTMYSAYDYFENKDLFEEVYELERIAPELAEIVKGKMFSVGDIFSAMIMGNLVHTSTVLLRRERLEKVKGFSARFERTGEDFDFHLRTCREGPVGYLDVSSIQYQIGAEDQLTAPGMTIQLARHFLQTIEPVIARERERIHLPDSMINLSLSEGYDWLGTALFLDGQYAEARDKLGRSLKYKPFRPNTFVFWIISMLKPAWIDQLRRLRKRIGGTESPR